MPFYRGGAFRGVVLADLSVRYFQNLHNLLQAQYLGQDSYSFVISADGILLYHPNPRYEFPAPDSTLDKVPASQEFRSLMREIRQQDAGRGHATYFDSGRAAEFFFAKIPATGGHFVLVRFDATPE